MTDNAVTIPRPAAPNSIVAGGSPSAFNPKTLPEAMQLATMIANSNMAPKSYENKEEKILVGMMAGAELGLPPMQSLQTIAVIGNMPAVWGDGALALVRASGLLEDISEEDDGNTATCTMFRRGQKTPIIRTFSMDDAKAAGLDGKTGPWKQYPKRMRQMRARLFALRDGFADVLKGLAIAEEVRDYATEIEGSAAPVTRVSMADLRIQAADPIDASLAADAAHLASDMKQPIEEGRADDQHGDQHDGTDDESPSEVETRRLIDLFGLVDSVGKMKFALGEFEKAAPGLSDDQNARIQSAADAVEARRKASEATE